MFNLLYTLTMVLVSLAMALSLAHSLELPGKLRLDQSTYSSMQRIYYPGFTIGGGIGEAGGMISTIVLLSLTPFGGSPFWLTLIALLSLICMQAVYWIFTHPINKFWVEGENLNRFSSRFFSLGTNRTTSKTEHQPSNWIELRNRWEYSHVVRAGFAVLSFIALVIAGSCGI